MNENLSEDCRYFQELLEGQLDEDNTFSSQEEVFLAAHPNECSACKVYRQEMQGILETLRALETLPVPDGLSDRILAKIHKPLPFKRPAVWAIAASVLALVVSTSVLSFWKGSLAPEPAETKSVGLVAALPEAPLQPPPPKGQQAVKPVTSPTAFKTFGGAKRKPAAPARSSKVLIAMGTPGESFPPTRVKSATEAEESSDLLAHWVPLAEEAPHEDFHHGLMGEDTEDNEDPISSLVGF